jgi:two-component system, LytTR family, sensor kinase
MALERYNKKELFVFIWVMLPYVAGINTIVFGTCIFHSLGLFAATFGLTAIYMFTGYYVFGLIATMIKKRFPQNSDLFRRIGVMLPVFYVMNILLITGLYAYYNTLQMVSCEPLSSRFWWAILFGCITSSIITFINEGLANWQGWKISVTETEQLKNTYQKTKLLGLRGQVNPHFLFNCFNSLSSLINEDEAEAEKFLNEMTKVHRYMLGCDDEQMVLVDEELKFVQSYLYLTDARFGNAIQATISVNEIDKEKYLPPLSVHTIIENIIYNNAISKAEPLRISISSTDNGLLIKNSIHVKITKENAGNEEGLDNLVKKYKLLNRSVLEIRETIQGREIVLPLIVKGEVVI